ncbi:MAG TPA: bifunctional tRNA (5-methylaminomethyl-2-thiouridine)(34)-methyltransferase MnmD/FAD-dependent 5-carboxymethylaminomethyl-2-thiouridine(34) oxidoreductase MnmC [Burkholderiaceae bacterium]|nr:bifunctional tRNA (5-methylaminomethyl-2-thiouridine)(34)-methyltransferase MnmD/FAD-dependent 5-carboxymethylaminomethyl-2-thiouridine(34) oxidoreductase MnmC [Burkholderiaceae bacterium]
MWRRIEPARVVLDATGAPFNELYGDVYASRDGALGQARHVFLSGNDLPARWQRRDQFVIVETGFGLGVNFLATWQAWRDDPDRPRRLHFVSVEKHPVDAEAIVRFAPPEVASLARELAATWPPALPGPHRREFEDGAVTLTLALGDAEHLLPQLVAGGDAFFLDGFAHERNPAMWSPAVMKSLTRLAREDATVATWCTARAAREALAAAGFDVTLAAGFGHRRHMLRAGFAPRWRMRRHEPPAAFSGVRDAIVIGAGLAGASAAWSLARRGWRVTVVERGKHAAAGASALPWGLLHPQVTADDNDAARLTRAGFFTARALLRELAPAGTWRQQPLWRADGTLVQAADAQEAERWQALAASLDLPRSFVQFLSAGEAASALGIRPQNGGWWFGGGTTVALARLCASMLESAGATLRAGAAIERVRRADDGWIAETADGTTIAAAPACVVATALDAPRLLQLRHAHVRAVRGRLSLLEAPALAPLRASTSGSGTLVAAEEGRFLVGASYEAEANDEPRDDEIAPVHEGNLQRLARMVAAPLGVTPAGVFDGTRCVARDRLPLVGVVADEPAVSKEMAMHGAHLEDLPRRAGLYASFAFGSRGLSLAPLAAELIAAQIEGEPWPLERELAARIDAARFLLQRMRGNAGLLNSD